MVTALTITILYRETTYVAGWGITKTKLIHGSKIQVKVQGWPSWSKANKNPPRRWRASPMLQDMPRWPSQNAPTQTTSHIRRYFLNMTPMKWWLMTDPNINDDSFPARVWSVLLRLEGTHVRCSVSKVLSGGGDGEIAWNNNFDSLSVASFWWLTLTRGIVGDPWLPRQPGIPTRPRKGLFLNKPIIFYLSIARYSWVGIVSFGVGCAEPGFPGAKDFCWMLNSLFFSTQVLTPGRPASFPGWANSLGLSSQRTAQALPLWWI